MRGRLPDKVRIQHILDAIAEVEKYITDISLQAFLEILRNDTLLLNK